MAGTQRMWDRPKRSCASLGDRVASSEVANHSYCPSVSSRSSCPSRGRAASCCSYATRRCRAGADGDPPRTGRRARSSQERRRTEGCRHRTPQRSPHDARRERLRPALSIAVPREPTPFQHSQAVRVDADVMSVNSTRRASADGSDLVNRLRIGLIGGACLDVVNQLPLDRQTHPPNKHHGMGNVILLRRLAFHAVVAIPQLECQLLSDAAESSKTDRSPSSQMPLPAGGGRDKPIVGFGASETHCEWTSTLAPGRIQDPSRS